MADQDKKTAAAAADGQGERGEENTGEPLHVIFDKTFKYIATRIPRLLIHLINYVFQTTHPIDAPVRFLSTEQQTGHGRQMMDLNVVIEGTRYHIECQALPDGRMRLRMVAYALESALDEALSSNSGEIILPRACALYLWRTTEKTEKELVTVIRNEEGEKLTYRAKVVAVQSLSAREMVEGGLWLLLPFHLLRYRTQSGKLRKNVRKSELVSEVHEMLRLLEEAAEKTGQLTVFYDLSQLIRSVADYVLRDHEEMRKAVENAITGGDHMKLFSEMEAELAKQKAELADKDAKLAEKDKMISDLLRLLERQQTA